MFETFLLSHGREIPSSPSPQTPRMRQGSSQGGTAELLRCHSWRMLTRKVTVRAAMRHSCIFPWMFLWDFPNQGEPVPSEGPHWALWRLGGKSETQKTQLRFARAAQARLCQGSQEDPLFLWSLWDPHCPAKIRIWLVWVTMISKCQMLLILGYLCSQMASARAKTKIDFLKLFLSIQLLL